MKIILPIVVILSFLSVGILANDGVFYASGDMLFPMKKTSIALRKEVLTITKRGDSMLVDVLFTFENPDTVQELLVGFVTPPSGGDRGTSETPSISISVPKEKRDDYYEDSLWYYIHNFTVIMNGKTLSARSKILGKSGFKLPKKDFGDYLDYVYYFTGRFEHGFNTIHHIYTMPLSSSVDEVYKGYYRLTTGRTWANKQIDDFTLTIHIDEKEIFVPETFVKSKKNADWQIIGKGKLSSKNYYRGLEGGRVKIAKIDSGYLSLHELNFKPDYDLYFGKERKD